MMALNCNKDIPEANFQEEMGVEPGHCYHCHTGRCPVGVATQDPKLRERLDPDAAAERVYNFLHTLTIEAQLFARACGKTYLHSLEPEDLAALTMEASAMAGVPLAGTNHTVGVEDYHHFCNGAARSHRPVARLRGAPTRITRKEKKMAGTQYRGSEIKDVDQFLEGCAGSTPSARRKSASISAIATT